jgi:hypothetical protein
MCHGSNIWEGNQQIKTVLARQLIANGNQAMPRTSSFRFFFIPFPIQKFKD